MNTELLDVCSPLNLHITNMTPDSNYYKLLNCSQQSSTEQILTEYKHLARIYHPDKALNNGSTSGKLKWTRISGGTINSSIT